MAERITIARPYAKAAFAQARIGKQLEHWSAVLQLAAAIASDSRVKSLFGNPHVTPEQLAELINGVAGAAFDGDARNFVATLAANRRMAFLPEITATFEQLRADHERTLEVTVTSAVTLSAEQREHMTAALGRRMNREVHLHCELDPALLGGAVLRADDLVIDGSVRGGLVQLAAMVAG